MRNRVVHNFVGEGFLEVEGAAVETGHVGGTRFGANRAKSWNQRSLEFALLGERDGLAADRRERVLFRLKGPAGVVVDLVRGEGQLDYPAAARLFPAGPAFVAGAEGGEAFANNAAEVGIFINRVRVDGGVHGNAERRGHHVFAFGDDGAFESAHVVERCARDGRDIFGAHSGADVRLHLPRAELGPGRRINLGLAKPGLERSVNGDPIAIPVFGGCKQRTVLDSYNLQFLHEERLSRLPTGVRLPRVRRKTGEYAGRAASCFQCRGGVSDAVCYSTRNVGNCAR